LITSLPSSRCTYQFSYDGLPGQAWCRFTCVDLF